jgi:hypothetical protein
VAKLQVSGVVGKNGGGHGFSGSGAGERAEVVESGVGGS